MSVSFLDLETDIMDQFLGPETDIMGEGNFMDPLLMQNLESILTDHSYVPRSAPHKALFVKMAIRNRVKDSKFQAIWSLLDGIQNLFFPP